MESLSKYLLVSAIVLFVLVFYKWLLRYLQRKEITQEFVYFFPFENTCLRESEILKVDMPYRATISAALYLPDGGFVKHLYEAELAKGIHHLELDFSDVQNSAYTLQIKSPFQLTRRKVIVKKIAILESESQRVNA